MAELSVTLLLAIINNAGPISAAIQKAQAEGRDKLTADEWNEILKNDDGARAELVAAIAKAGQ
jgi:hypothetical protein